MKNIIKNIKIKREYVLIILAVLLACVFTVTLAYFSVQVLGNSEGSSGVSTGTFEINVSDNEIEVDSLAPIYDNYYELQAYKKTFTVSSDEDSTLNSCTNIYLQIDTISEGLKSEYLKYKLVSDGETVGEGNFQNATNTEDFKLNTEPLFIKPGESVEYTLYIWISYEEEIDQMSLLGTTLSGIVKAVGRDAKYKSVCYNLPEGQYFVTFDASGGELLSSTTITVTNNQAYGILPTPTRANYKFLGWYTSASGGTQVTESTTANLTEDQTLYAQWINYVGWNLYDVIKENAVLDNGPSRFVKSDTGIDFLEIASDENGKGVYIISDTLDDDNPIYYYRGAIDNNNVLFANFCWKMLRTTDTGGIKLVYNGVPVDGRCDNTGWDTQIASGIYFNPTSISIAGAGYSYTDTSDLVMKSKKDTEVAEGTIFAYNIDYNEETGKYALIGDKITTTSNLTAEKYDQIKEHHFTCFKTVDEDCDTVSFVYMARNNYIYYAILKNGQDEIDDILHIDFEGGSSNEKPSTLQTTINNWYSVNMLNYSGYIEDTIYCNDRSIYNPWSLTSSIANDDNLKLSFDTKARIAFTGKPTVDCKYKADSFTVSPQLGNGVLEYPVATISYDEASFAGVPWWKSDSDNFLNNGYVWWTMSPGFISTTGVYNGIISSQLDHVAVNWIGTKTTINSINYYAGGGVRPVISLKSGVIVRDGFGTVDKPFVIE